MTAKIDGSPFSMNSNSYDSGDEERVIYKTPAELQEFRDSMLSATAEWPDRQLLNVERHKHYAVAVLVLIICLLTGASSYPVLAHEHAMTTIMWLFGVNCTVAGLVLILWHRRPGYLHLHERKVAFGSISKFESIVTRVAVGAPYAVVYTLAASTAACSAFWFFNDNASLAMDAVIACATTMVALSILINTYKSNQ